MTPASDGDRIERIAIGIEALRVEVKRDIEVLPLEVKRDLAETKADLTRWVVGAGILQTSLIIGVLLKVAKLIQLRPVKAAPTTTGEKPGCLNPVGAVPSGGPQHWP